MNRPALGVKAVVDRGEDGLPTGFGGAIFGRVTPDDHLVALLGGDADRLVAAHEAEAGDLGLHLPPLNVPANISAAALCCSAVQSRRG